jgi:glutamine synthetase
MSTCSITVHGYSLLRTQLNKAYFEELFDASSGFDIAIEGHRTSFDNVISAYDFMVVNADTETGPGVFETALAYTTALRLADNAVLFKYLAKSVGMKHGVMPTFMAKPWGNVRLASLHAAT